MRTYKYLVSASNLYHYHCLLKEHNLTPDQATYVQWGYSLMERRFRLEKIRGVSVPREYLIGEFDEQEIWLLTRNHPEKEKE